MCVSRCLGPALTALGAMPRADWRGYINALPEACPHSDCTQGQGCRAFVADRMRTVWQVQAEYERRRGDVAR